MVPEGAIPVSHHPWGYFNPFNDHNLLVNIVSRASDQVTLCKAFGENYNIFGGHLLHATILVIK